MVKQRKDGVWCIYMRGYNCVVAEFGKANRHDAEVIGEILDGKILDGNQRENAWNVVIHALNNTRDADLRAIIVKSAIADIGPVPDSMNEAVNSLTYSTMIKKFDVYGRRFNEWLYVDTFLSREKALKQIRVLLEQSSAYKSFAKYTEFRIDETYTWK